jgi:hypothetical protein
MIPLAVSGQVFLAAVIAGALLLVAILLRSEQRYEARQRSEQELRDEEAKGP